ncbi:MAG TPA: DNA polymerase III subunit gamma/tau C-terminal domain-containing protein, partial [Methylotenera sp.]|nr:DNA polymerase III subunit gamma/tau C-terminal domain-containing protein [Methylotenera sp.]
IIGHLQHILTEENIPFEATALHLIARAANGSMRDALSLTDQAIAYGSQSVNEAEVRAMLGAIDQSYLYQILSALISNDGKRLIEQAKHMEERSISFEAALNDLAQLLHQISVAQTVPDSVADDLPERAQLLALAQQLPAETLQLYYQIAILGRRDIGLAPDEFAGFTMSLMRMLAFTPVENSTQKTQSRPQVPTAIKATPGAEKPSFSAPEIAPQPTEAIQPTEPFADTAINQDVMALDGNWRGLIDKLKLGLARNLALNSALLSYDEHTLRFAIQDKDKALLSPMYKDKLSLALEQYFGRKIRLEFSVENHVQTPAKQVAEEKAISQSNAESAIHEDDFVKALLNEFGAEIIPNSIKPMTQ